MPILYLGLDPSRYPRKVFHYPVIRTVPVGALGVEAKVAWSSATHVLFTSRSAVKHWLALSSVEGKEVLAVGPATAALLGADTKIAPVATQEGVVDLLKTMDLSGTFLFWPRSALARPVVTDYLTNEKVPFYALDLYETKWQRPEPVPDLADFDEIVFTSPTTVDAFLNIFGTLPKDKRLTPIGPVTEKALQRRGLFIKYEPVLKEYVLL